MNGQLKVLGLTFEVSEACEDDRAFYEHLQSDDKLYYGRIIHAEQKIVIRKDLKNDRKSETLWHEIIHAISAAYGMELEEQQVTLLGSAIDQVIKDNEWISHL